MASSSLGSIVGNLLQAYSAETDKRTKIIDLYMACILLTGIVQFVYCALVGTFPFNSFLSGFLCTVAMFVLTGASPRAAPRAPMRTAAGRVAPRDLADLADAHRERPRAASLRMQVTSPEFKHRIRQRAFADYAFCCVILFLGVTNFLG